MAFNLFKDNQVEKQLEKYTVTTEIVREDGADGELEKTIVMDPQADGFNQTRSSTAEPSFVLEEDEALEDDDDEYEYITPHYLRNAIVVVLLFMVIGIVATFFLTRDQLSAAARTRYLEQGYMLTNDANAGPNDITKGLTAYVKGKLITGTYEDLNTYGATAGPEDILEGYTAYVKGRKITGTIPIYSGSNALTPGVDDIVISEGVYINSAITVLGDSSLTPANIKSGVQIWRVTGVYTGE